MTDLMPAGRPNLVAEPAPRRGTMPGPGGFIPTPTMVAITPPGPEAAEDWQAREVAAKLAAAPKAARDRLRSEEERTAKAQGNVAEAERSEARARGKLVAARLNGRGIDRASQDFDRATAHVVRARRDAAISADVLEQLRQRILASVRADLESQARAKLGAAHQRYDAALAALSGVPLFVRELAAAREAEASAAAELADATGLLPGFQGGKRMERAVGSRYRTIPDVDGLVLTIGEVRLDVEAAVTSRLGRRSDLATTEERPVLRPVDS